VSPSEMRNPLMQLGMASKVARELRYSAGPEPNYQSGNLSYML
jgi:hypothetical protein